MSHAVEVEIERNFAVFADMLVHLLPDQRGRYALLHDQKLIGTYGSAGEAERAGYARFSTAPYSIQLVTDEVADLGFQSYAIREGQIRE